MLDNRHWSRIDYLVDTYLKKKSQQKEISSAIRDFELMVKYLENGCIQSLLFSGTSS